MSANTVEIQVIYWSFVLPVHSYKSLFKKFKMYIMYLGLNMYNFLLNDIKTCFKSLNSFNSIFIKLLWNISRENKKNNSNSSPDFYTETNNLLQYSLLSNTVRRAEKLQKSYSVRNSHFPICTFKAIKNILVY